MTPMDWFGVGYVVVMVILIFVYIGVYFGWFWGGINMKYVLIKTIIESIAVLGFMYLALMLLLSL